MDPIFLVCLKESCDTLLKKRLLFPKFLHIWCSTNCTGLKDNLATSITLGRHKHGVKARHQTAANWLPWITSKGVSQTKSLDPACSSGGHLKSFWGAEKPSILYYRITSVYLFSRCQLRLVPPGSTGSPGKPEKAAYLGRGDAMHCALFSLL